MKTLIEGFVNSDAVKAHLSARATARASQQILNLSLLAKMPVDQLSDAAVSSWNQAHPQQQLDRHAAWSQRAQQLADILGGDAAVSDADAALIREATEALPEHLRAHAAFTERTRPATPCTRRPTRPSRRASTSSSAPRSPRSAGVLLSIPTPKRSKKCST
ncbi:hypothetical protein E4K10_47040 [Streptomyces sp. T1317-0309]|nr:hypothetical protein E4K10_47040 [Streptomyces sp. T1317-0309]